MAYEKLVAEVQALLNDGKTDEVVDCLFTTYLQTHPSARNIKDYRDRISYKLRNEFAYIPDADAKAKIKLLVYGFMTLVSDSEGETGYNLVLLLLHLIHKNHQDQIREVIEVIKLERASRNLEGKRDA